MASLTASSDGFCFQYWILPEYRFDYSPHLRFEYYGDMFKLN